MKALRGSGKDLTWLTSEPIAHRGLHDDLCPENSLAAFGNAVASGMPFEFDVQFTRTGTAVVLHDRDTGRVAGERIAVPDLSDGDLRRLRLRSSDQAIPTLVDVLDLVAGKVPIVVDVRRWRFEPGAGFERAIAGAVRDYSGPLALQSFDPAATFRLKRLLPDKPVGQISGSLASAGLIPQAVGRAMLSNILTWPDFISYELNLLPSRAVSFWRGRSGVPVLAWTAYSRADEERAGRFADNFFFSGYTPRAYSGVRRT